MRYLQSRESPRCREQNAGYRADFVMPFASGRSANMCADHVETDCSGMALQNLRVFCAGRDARAKRAYCLDGDELQVPVFE
jgi:hypothetical protein